MSLTQGKPEGTREEASGKDVDDQDDQDYFQPLKIQ